MDKESFGNLVTEALDSLPEQFQNALDNVEILVEDWPDRETLRLARVSSPYGLLGFYHGVPLTQRTAGYNLVPPDKISIYQKPIEAQCASEDEVKALVRRVVLHEIAHFFGISDERLREIGAY
jgi:predicted Zn-dependent protease with MMP-like domain